MFLRRMKLATIGVGTAAVLTVSVVAGQQPMAQMDHGMMMDGMKSGAMTTMTKDQKIANAMSAAPAALSGKAKILDWPAKEGAASEMLRAGNNGWTCFPDRMDTKGNDPMCLDAPWLMWIDALLAHKAPAIKTLGIGYMAGPGGSFGSNTDPFAMEEVAGNHWGHHMPHLMILVPDLKSLAGISTDPGNGGPYVMFAGTPYAHIMAPTSGSDMMAMPMH